MTENVVSINKTEVLSLSERYEEKIKELRKELPSRNDFTKLWVYKEGKCIREFKLNEYEANLDLLKETEVNANSVFKDQVPQFLINAGYGVEISVDESKFEPRLKEYSKKESSMSKQFEIDLKKEHKFANVPPAILKDAYTKARLWQRDGSFEFIEKAYVEIIELCEKANKLEKY